MVVQILTEDGLSLFKAGMCPAANLHFSCSEQPPFIRPEVLAIESSHVEPYSRHSESRSQQERKGPASTFDLNGTQQGGAEGKGEKKVPRWLKLAKK